MLVIQLLMICLLLLARSSVIYNHIELEPMRVDVHVPDNSILTKLSSWKHKASSSGLSLFLPMVSSLTKKYSFSHPLSGT